MLSLLAIYRELDICGYDMLERISVNSSFRVYIAVSSDKERALVKGKCMPLMIPPIRSKIEWRVIRLLRTYLHQYHIDIVFAPGSSGLSNSLFASLGMNVRNVGYRGTQARIHRTDITYYLGILNPRVSHIVCETEDIRDYLTRFISSDKLSVNLKPFDIKWVENACRFPKQYSGLPANAITCVYVGCCKGRPFKGLSCLVKAMHLLKDERIHLLFIGDYDTSDYELARSGPANGRIHFLGFQDNPLNYVCAQDIFVLPSLRDASPRVVREAMACSLPCIVSDIPGARDLLIDGVTGILVPPNNPRMLANAMLELADNQEMRKKMGRAGRERIKMDFSVDLYAQKFEKLFLSLK
ncbi:glycosyltransferase [Bacteroides gallinaceum]|uniref:glycosyltransferase n=1 Tax=Bacteroides gallinaceum TaxID=1462571 RepID=UPI0025A3F84B|nr:glycosyltransferase [Bacteroides gallinaceum]MDM8208103.1 glycosyltransferase [Bacteroides gallinaceum]